MTDAPRYEIRTTADFLKVPMDRLDTCLREFGMFLAVSGAVQDALGDVPYDGPKPGELFIWVDDGLSTMTIDITSADGTPIIRETVKMAP